MDILLHNLSDGSPLSIEVRLKIGIVRLWETHSYDGDKQIITSLEMVLADQEGCRIQASVPEELVHLFRMRLFTGGVYIISSFRVVRNLGSYRVTNHGYRLIFKLETVIRVIVGALSRMNDLCFVDSSVICRHQSDCDFLADVIGVLIAMSEPMEYNVEGKISKLMLLELLDTSGRIRCLVSGECTSKLKVVLSGCTGDKPVVVIRFAKIKMFLGYPYVENVKDISQIFVDPNIMQVTDFRKRLSVCGIPADASIASIGPKMREYGEADFLLFYPKKTIVELDSIIEDGKFVISACLTGFIDGEDWWFPSLSCHEVEKDASTLIGDNGNADYEFHLISRFRAKFTVFDGTSEAVFVLFDDDLSGLIEERCAHLLKNMKGKHSKVCPPQFQSLFGRNLLFLVEKESTSNPTLDCCYRVVKVCDNPLIIDLFNGKNSKFDFEFFPSGGCECHARGR